MIILFTLIMIKQDAMKKNIKISFFMNSLFDILFHILNETWIKLINFWIVLSSVKTSFKFYIKYYKLIYFGDYIMII